MTETNTDQLAFLRAIAAQPDDDTLRLVYADWLDEHAEGPADVGRAELIRVQCELATMRTRPEAAKNDHECVQCFYRRTGGRTTNGPCRCSASFGQLRERERALLAAHEADWRAGPVCTGDVGGLLEKFYSQDDRYMRGAANWLYPVHFDRGFITRVTVPTLAELVLVRAVPSPLLRSIVGKVKDAPAMWVAERSLVAEVVPGNREPENTRNGTCYFQFYEPAHGAKFRLPRVVMLQMRALKMHRYDETTSNDTNHLNLIYDTPERAVSALGRAIAQWGRA